MDPQVRRKYFKSNWHRGNSRGRFQSTNFRGRSRGGRGYNKVFIKGQAKQVTVNKEQESVSAQVTGENKVRSNDSTNPNKIVFIADSGATEHVINKSFLLKDFEKLDRAFIKCANKNKQANIKIDGKGNLVLNQVDLPTQSKRLCW